MLKKIKGLKTYLGVVAGGVLGLVVAWSPEDAITWDTQWVQLTATAIGAWTGIAIRSAIATPK
jgi:hypothetical protein